MSLCPNSHSDTHNKPKHKRTYETFNYPCATSGEKTLLTGIRGKTHSHKVLISGFYVPTNKDNTSSFVYEGYECGKGKFHDLNHPSVDGVPTTTNLYGPNNGKKEGTIQVVGNYTTQNVSGGLGCLYTGSLDGSGTWTTIVPTPLTSDPIIFTICHSTMGNLIVGNYDTILIQGKAFIYDINTKKYYNIVNPSAISITAYGIWHDGGKWYTICGGYTTAQGTNVAYLAKWNNKTHQLSSWQNYHYKNDETTKITHFDGITGGPTPNTYNLTGDWANVGTESGFFAQAKFYPHKHRFSRKAKWSPITFPPNAITSGNSVYKSTVIGVYANLLNDSIDGYISRVKHIKTKSCPKN